MIITDPEISEKITNAVRSEIDIMGDMLKNTLKCIGGDEKDMFILSKEGKTIEVTADELSSMLLTHIVKKYELGILKSILKVTP